MISGASSEAPVFTRLLVGFPPQICDLGDRLSGVADLLKKLGLRHDHHGGGCHEDAPEAILAEERLDSEKPVFETVKLFLGKHSKPQKGNWNTGERPFPHLMKIV